MVLEHVMNLQASDCNQAEFPLNKRGFGCVKLWPNNSQLRKSGGVLCGLA